MVVGNEIFPCYLNRHRRSLLPFLREGAEVPETCECVVSGAGGFENGPAVPMWYLRAKQLHRDPWVTATHATETKNLVKMLMLFYVYESVI